MVAFFHTCGGFNSPAAFALFLVCSFSFPGHWRRTALIDFPMVAVIRFLSPEILSRAQSFCPPFFSL